MDKKIFPFLALAAMASLASCSSDDGPSVAVDNEPVPAGMTRVKLSPQLLKPSRGYSASATTANLKDFDFIITFTNPAGQLPMKGRYDVTNNTVYTSDGGTVGAGKLLVPRNSVFTVTALACANEGTSVETRGGIIGYLATDTGEKQLETSDGGLVQDYVLGTSESVTANTDAVNVPVTMAHQSSKITFSAEVVGQDYAVVMDPRIVMTGGKTAWSVNQTTGAFTSTGDSKKIEFYLKPQSSANCPAANLSPLFNPFLASVASDGTTPVSAGNMVVLCNKDGKKGLMYDALDSPFSLDKWGTLENARQLFWWPGAYSQTPNPAWSGDTFNGGFSIILNYQVFHGVYDANGKLVLDGAPFRTSRTRSLGGGEPVLGSYHMVVPVDLTGSKALEAGKAYNFNIKFMTNVPTPDPDPNSQDPVSVTITPTITDWVDGGTIDIQR